MADDIKFGLVEQINSTRTFGPLEVSGETKVRFIVENATMSNSITVSGRITGQSDWDILTTFNGNTAQTLSVELYDDLLVEVTSYASSSTYVRIVASGFNPAEGTAIASIGVPFGTNISESTNVDFTSSNGTIKITGNNATGTVDFILDGAANPNSYGVIVPTIGTTPTANSASDTLTMTSTDDSIVVTGDASAESLDFQAGPAVKNNLVKQESRSITMTEYTNKELILAATPLIANKTRLTIVGGPEQKYALDFLVSGDTLTWSSMGIDGIIEFGDSLVITYP